MASAVEISAEVWRRKSSVLCTVDDVIALIVACRLSEFRSSLFKVVAVVDIEV